MHAYGAFADVFRGKGTEEMIKKYVQNLKSFLKNHKPETLIILGSGLGALAQNIEDAQKISYENLGFPKINVSGHAGQLTLGRVGGKDVLLMEGRYHLYEGHQPELIKDLLSAFAAVGIKRLVVTNAAGSLNPKIKAGSVVIIKDHINLSGKNPLIGVNNDSLGPRFPSMNNVYDVSERKKLKKIGARMGLKLREGVYMMVLGPNFETPSEVRAFRRLGADMVGMSTVTEVITAAYLSMPVTGLSVITNMAAGLQKTAPSHAETLETAQKASQTLVALLHAYLEEL